MFCVFTNVKFHNLILTESWVSQVLDYSSFVKTTSFAKIEVSEVVCSLKDFCFTSLKFLGFTILYASKVVSFSRFRVFKFGKDYKFHNFQYSKV